MIGAYITRWKDREEPANFARNFDRPYGDQVELHIATHGSQDLMYDQTTADAIRRGDALHLNVEHPDGRAVMGRMMSAIFHDGLSKGFEAVALIDDDAYYEFPITYFRAYSLAISQQNIGATGPCVVPDRSLRQTCYLQDLNAPLNHKVAIGYATGGSQVYATSLVEKVLPWFDEYLKGLIWHGDFVLWALARHHGYDLAKINMPGFHHRMSNSTKNHQEYNLDWYLRRIAVHIHDYDLIDTALQNYPGLRPNWHALGSKMFGHNLSRTNEVIRVKLTGRKSAISNGAERMAQIPFVHSKQEAIDLLEKFNYELK